MTPEAQRIAIAEACGWKPAKSTGIIFHGWQKEKDFRTLSQLPRYERDLNAMHEAEKVLTGEQCSLHQAHLEVTCKLYPEIPASDYDFWAPSAQRAEAFLRTLGLWT